MKLVNGKFFNDDGVQVPLEFGNNDQIQLLEKVKFFKDGVMPHFTFNDSNDKIIGLHLFCVCGGIVEIMDESMSEIDGKKINCSKCNFTYKVCDDEDFDFPYFKLIV